ncbi:MAG: hypothetical protein KKE17_14985 [Proteobacteria bacterium]|nr:hypothetical protein [Pseudomonadota bacterium]MBU1711303.1 hypothetical protein [Pseudomonadota bacterium]
MKKNNGILVLFMILLWSGITHASDTLDYVEVLDNLSLSKQTSLHVEMYWQKIRDSQVTWKGVVQNVKGGRGKAEIYVANPDAMTYKGYNLILISYDLEAAAGLKVGDSISFSGRLQKYTGKKGRPVVITLIEAQVH